MTLALELPRTDLPDPQTNPQARCRSVSDPDIFFPVGAASSEPAKLVCGACPIAATCLAWGEATAQYGIWGGEYLEEGRVTVRRRPGRPRKVV